MNLKKIKDDTVMTNLVIGKGDNLNPKDTARNTTIKSVDMSESEMIILPEYAFLKCSDLESVVLPKTLEILGYSAFYMCPKLKAIKFPDSLQIIYGGAFAGCKSLTEVIIPSSVERVSVAAFEYCSSLDSVTIKSLNTEIDESAFDNCPMLKNIQTPLGLVPKEVFKKAGNSSEGTISWDLLKSFQNPDGSFSMGNSRRKRMSRRR